MRRNGVHPAMQERGRAIPAMPTVPIVNKPGNDHPKQHSKTNPPPRLVPGRVRSFIIKTLNDFKIILDHRNVTSVRCIMCTEKRNLPNTLMFLEPKNRIFFSIGRIQWLRIVKVKIFIIQKKRNKKIGIVSGVGRYINQMSHYK